MQIIIFGTGIIYNRIKEVIPKDTIIVRLLDNNSKLWGSFIDGIKVVNPIEVSGNEYDFIVLASNYAKEMQEQLIKIGCSQDKILHYYEFLSKYSSSKITVCLSDEDSKKLEISKNATINEVKNRLYRFEKNVLIITYILDYSGSSIAVLNAASALKDRGYLVMLAAPCINNSLMEEMTRRGHSFIITPQAYLPNSCLIDLFQNFEYILVNTFPMFVCALELAKKCKVIEWLHESEIIYEQFSFYSDRIAANLHNKHMVLYAVSEVARENFLKHYPNIRVEIMPYGIPDNNLSHPVKQKKSSRVTFALVAGLEWIKGQDVFIDAVELLNREKYAANYLLIGKNDGRKFARDIIDRVAYIPNLDYLGELNREELQKVYLNEIDIVVVPSRQETMSMVATEAMMYGKTCIVSDVAGISNYIKDGVNGFVYDTNDVEALFKKMKWCLDNNEKMKVVCEGSRELYERFFSMNVFAQQLESALL